MHAIGAQQGRSINNQNLGFQAEPARDVVARTGSSSSFAGSAKVKESASLPSINSVMEMPESIGCYCCSQDLMRKAWQITGIGRMAEIQMPENTAIKPFHVELSPVAIGLCGSDDRYVHQDPDSAPENRRRPFGYIVGHEVIARVKSLGAGVSGFAEGDLVAVNPHTKPLLPGKVGQRDNLIPGRNNFLATPMDAGALDTGFQHPASRLSALPKDVDINVVALSEPMACSLNAVLYLMKAYDPKCHPNGESPLSNQTVVVQGAGSIGQNTAILLANINAVMAHYKDMPRTPGGKGVREIFNRPVENLRILVTCVNDAQLRNIEGLFRNKTQEMINHNIQVIPVRSGRTLQSLELQESGLYSCETFQKISECPSHDEQQPGAAAVIECSGGKEALEQSAQRVRPRGKIIHIARNQFDPAVAQRGEKSMQPTYRFKAKHFQQSVEMLTQGKLPQVKDMALEHYRWDETADAFDPQRRTANKRIIHGEPITSEATQALYTRIADQAPLQRTNYQRLVSAPNSELSDIAKALADQTGIEANLETGALSYGQNFKPLELHDSSGKAVKVLFVRHGQVSDNVEPRTFNGNVDRQSTQLTKKGKAQARDAASLLGQLSSGIGANQQCWSEVDGEFKDTLAWLESLGWTEDDIDAASQTGFQISKIFSSPLGRAKETAEAAYADLNVGTKDADDSGVELNSGLREMSFGSVDGRKLISVGSENPYHLLRSDQNGLAKDVAKRFDASNQSENFAEVVLRTQKALKGLRIPPGTDSILIVGHSMTGAAARALFGRAPQQDGVIQFDGGKGMMKNATPYVLSLASSKS